MAHRHWRGYLNARALPHVCHRPTGRRAHVTAVPACTMKAQVLKVLTVRSLVTSTADGGGASVTAASAMRVRRTGVAEAVSGFDGATGSHAEHAAGPGDGGARTLDDTRAGATADGTADAGARRSRHRRGGSAQAVRRAARGRRCAAARNAAPDRAGGTTTGRTGAARPVVARGVNRGRRGCRASSPSRPGCR